MVQVAFDATRDWSQIWADGLDYLFNNQLASQRRRKGWDRIQANYIYPAVVQTMATIAQRRPRIVAQPVEPSDTTGAATWGRVLQWQFEKVLRMQRKLMQAALDGAVFGHYVAKTLWEPKARWDADRKEWIGQPRVAIVHPQYFGADPEAECVEDATFAVCKRRVPTAYATARWPKFAEAIENAAAGETFESYVGIGNPINHPIDGHVDNDPGETAEGRLVNLINRRFNDAAISSEADTGAYVTIEEVYFHDLAERKSKDEREIPYAELAQAGLISENEDGYWTDANTGEPFTERQTEIAREYDEPIYPFGRYVLRIGAGSDRVILNDDQDKQVWPYVNWPYTVGVNALLPHVWQGLNQVEMARGHQDWLNITMSHMANYVRQFADPIVKVEQGALQGSEDNSNIASKIAARAGAIGKMARGKLDRAQRMPPPPMSESLIAFYQLMGEGIKDQLGVQDVALGKETAGATTATEVWQLAINSRQATTLKSILLDGFTQQVMGSVLELDQASMSPNEQVRITGGEGTVTVSQEMLSGYYDVTLDVAMAMPFDAQRKQAEAQALFQAVGEPYMAELLDAFEVPNKDEILQRIEAAKGGPGGPTPGADAMGDLAAMLGGSGAAPGPAEPPVDTPPAPEPLEGLGPGPAPATPAGPTAPIDVLSPAELAADRTEEGQP